MKRLKRLCETYNDADVRFHVSLILVSLSIFLLTLRYAIPAQRLYDAIIDFGLSIAYWFVFITEPMWENFLGYVPQISTSRRKLPSIDFEKVFPFSFDEIVDKFSNFFAGLFNLDNFLDYNLFILELLYNVTLYGSMLIPSAVMMWQMFRDSLVKDKENPVGSFTQSVEIVLTAVRTTVRPVVSAVRGLVLYIYDHPWIWRTLLVTWLLNLNIFTIIFEFFGFYFYFISSADLISFFFQIIKLLVDVVIMFDGLPLILWIPIIFAIYWAYCSYVGLDTLRHFDAMNCGFLKSIAYISLLIGAPGVGKTTLLTSFSLYFVNIYKKDSFDTLYDVEMTFPAFPFPAFRKELDERIKSGVIYNIPKARQYVDHIEEVYKAKPSPSVLFGYDEDLFAMEKNESTRIRSLFSALREYASAYFIYRCENPNLSNYPIRFDGKFDDSTYLPLWNGDFYSRDPRKRKEESRYSHILDQDILRPGKKVDPDNKNIGCFGFGIYSNTEWGKARGNQLTTVDEDKASEIANRKNDLYSYSLKMSRHANTTVANKVYFRFLGDEQRPESLAADQRELCDVISIIDKSEIKLALPHFKWLDKLYDKVYEPFKDFWAEYSNARGDTCLTVFLLKLAVGGFSNVYKRIYNKYGYYTITLSLKDGRSYGNSKDSANAERIVEYNMPVMQVYSERYNTDCFSGFFTKAQLDCAVGINDLECFTGLTQTNKQMVAQHDFFLDEYMGTMEKHCGEPAKRTKRTSANTENNRVQPNIIFKTF
ncbi:MAG: hypothetical protein E7670_00285 [Ruminococcaceae bacterium]|nr:hypothetical protein [Oscillospiraceae bacterium]